MRKTVFAVAALAATILSSQPAAGQALPPQVQALYPQQTGEVVFADLRGLRASKHYAQIKAQVLPERFRQLEQFGMILGIDFEREVHQLSWGFVGQPDGGVSFVGVAEGSFPPGEIEGKARAAKLPLSRFQGAPMVVMGVNAQGKSFVFAFPDRTTAVFGYRETVEEMLTRRTQGGASLTDNAALRDVLADVNGKAPLWVALDNPYTVLAVKQMLPEAAKLPGFDTLTGRLRSASVRFDLRDGLRGTAAVRCESSADSLLLSTILQGALTYQGYQLGDKNPELARAVKEVTLNRQEERLNVGFAIRDADLVTLLQKNTLTLNF